MSEDQEFVVLVAPEQSFVIVAEPSPEFAVPAALSERSEAEDDPDA